MKFKIVLIVILIGVLTATGSYMMLFKGNDFLKDFDSACKKYEKANAVDYDAQRSTNEQLKSQVDFTKSEISVLKSNLKNLDSEHAAQEVALREEKTKEISDQANALRVEINDLNMQIQNIKNSQEEDSNIYFPSTGDQIYSILLDSIDSTTTDIVTFFANESKDGLYTVKFVGYFDSLTSVMENLYEELEPYNLSIGNASLRQIYSCFNNMREWDKLTLLKWFDNKYINSNGGISNIEGGYEVDGIKLSGLIGNETVESLTAAMENAIAENAAYYENRISNIEKERVASIIAAGNGTDADKVAELVNALNKHYDNQVTAVRNELAVKEAEIRQEYQARIDAIEGNNNQEEGFNIANPDMLIYTLDITFSVHVE